MKELERRMLEGNGWPYFGPRDDNPYVYILPKDRSSIFTVRRANMGVVLGNCRSGREARNLDIILKGRRHLKKSVSF